MSAALALLALVAQVDVAMQPADGWRIVRQDGAARSTGYAGYLMRDTATIQVRFVPTRTGGLVATVRAQGCAVERDLNLDYYAEPRPASDFISGSRRPAAVQARLSSLVTHVARACRVARPSDRHFFRGFRRAFIAFERADP